jgi:hypothetical protein
LQICSNEVRAENHALESARLEMMPAQIEDCFREALSVTEGIPAHFLLNLDERCLQEWIDRETQICSVQAFHLEEHVNVPILRRGEG